MKNQLLFLIDEGLQHLLIPFLFFLKVIAAEGEQKASRALREAAETIAGSHSALQVSCHYPIIVPGLYFKTGEGHAFCWQRLSDQDQGQRQSSFPSALCAQLPVFPLIKAAKDDIVTLANHINRINHETPKTAFIKGVGALLGQCLTWGC